MEMDTAVIVGLTFGLMTAVFVIQGILIERRRYRARQRNRGQR